MAKKEKPHFRFGLSQLFRVSLFLLIFTYLVTNLSQAKSPPPYLHIYFNEFLPNISTSLHKVLPNDFIEKLNKIPSTPLVTSVTLYLKDFPSKQVNQFKNEIAKQIYQSIIRDR